MTADRPAVPQDTPAKCWWYFVSSTYCPICAHTETLRERRYDERPARWEDRHDFIETWDGCNAF